jgi:hypothetical protein
MENNERNVESSVLTERYFFRWQNHRCHQLWVSHTREEVKRNICKELVTCSKEYLNINPDEDLRKVERPNFLIPVSMFHGSNTGKECTDNYDLYLYLKLVILTVVAVAKWISTSTGYLVVHGSWIPHEVHSSAKWDQQEIRPGEQDYWASGHQGTCGMYLLLSDLSLL